MRVSTDRQFDPIPVLKFAMEDMGFKPGNTEQSKITDVEIDYSRGASGYVTVTVTTEITLDRANVDVILARQMGDPDHY